MKESMSKFAPDTDSACANSDNSAAGQTNLTQVAAPSHGHKRNVSAVLTLLRSIPKRPNQRADLMSKQQHSAPFAVLDVKPALFEHHASRLGVATSVAKFTSRLHSQAGHRPSTKQSQHKVPVPQKVDHRKALSEHGRYLKRIKTALKWYDILAGFVLAVVIMAVTLRAATCLFRQKHQNLSVQDSILRGDAVRNGKFDPHQSSPWHQATIATKRREKPQHVASLKEALVQIDVQKVDALVNFARVAEEVRVQVVVLHPVELNFVFTQDFALFKYRTPTVHSASANPRQ